MKALLLYAAIINIILSNIILFKICHAPVRIITQDQIEQVNLEEIPEDEGYEEYLQELDMI